MGNVLNAFARIPVKVKEKTFVTDFSSDSIKITCIGRSN